MPEKSLSVTPATETERITNFEDELEVFKAHIWHCSILAHVWRRITNNNTQILVRKHGIKYEEMMHVIRRLPSFEVWSAFQYHDSLVPYCLCLRTSLSVGWGWHHKSGCWCLATTLGLKLLRRKNRFCQPKTDAVEIMNVLHEDDCVVRLSAIFKHGR